MFVDNIADLPSENVVSLVFTLKLEGKHTEQPTPWCCVVEFLVSSVGVSKAAVSD